MGFLKDYSKQLATGAVLFTGVIIGAFSYHHGRPYIDEGMQLLELIPKAQRVNRVSTGLEPLIDNSEKPLSRTKPYRYVIESPRISHDNNHDSIDFRINGTHFRIETVPYTEDKKEAFIYITPDGVEGEKD